MSSPAPSVAYGFRRAVELWRVVLAVFLGSAAVFLPVRLVLWATAGETLGSLPGGDLPDGELVLILVELLLPVWPAVALAAVSSIVSLWAWTVLWHAGVVRWLVFSGRRDVRLAEILSRGLFGWWRWARLGLVSLGVLLVCEVALALIFAALRNRAHDVANDWALGIALETGIVLGLFAAVVCWLATLRGAWLLGEVTRSSAVLAWLAGLSGVVRQPLRSLLALVVWAVPGLVFASAPPLAGWRFEALRAPFVGGLVGAVAGILGAFCLVGLFLSFAPITGLTRDGHTDRPE